MSTVTAPPPPKVRVSVGVTGHRAAHPLYSANSLRITDAMAAIFDAIDQAADSAPRLLGPESRAPTRLHTLLVDGTDQAASKLALQREWELVSPLPFGQRLNLAINALPDNAKDARALIAGVDPENPETMSRVEGIQTVARQARLFQLADQDEAIAALYLDHLEDRNDFSKAQSFALESAQRAAIFLASAGIAQPFYPDDRAKPIAISQPGDAAEIREKRIQSYFKSYSTGEATQYKNWLEANRTPEALASAPMDVRITNFQNDYQESGPLNLTTLRMSGPNIIEADAVADDGNVTTYFFEFEDATPYRVGALNIRRGGPPMMQVNLPQNWKNLDELANIIHDLSGIPAVAIGVYKAGKSETAIAGERVLGDNDPALIDDSFHWGSVGKSVTGTVIGALIERGSLDWDTTVGQVFGDVPMQGAYKDVKIWQLMAHQAGVPAYTLFDESFNVRLKSLPGKTDSEKRAAFVLQMLKEPLAYHPGTTSQYSNGGPTIAGRMAEIVSGKTWEELVQEYVFASFRMTTGGFKLPVSDDHPVGIRGHYEIAPKQFEPQSIDEVFLDPDVIAPAGGVHSSIGDLLRYGKMHLEGLEGKSGLISAEVIKSLHTPRPGQPKSFGEDYTFGWGARCPFPNPRNFKCQAHNGGGGTFFAQIVLIPELDVVIAYMANTTPAAEMLVEPLLETILERYAPE